MRVEEFRKGMQLLTDFYAKSLGDKASDVWWSKVRNLDYDFFLKAIDEITSNERQMPTPAILLKYAEEAKSLKRDSNQIEFHREECGVCNGCGIVTAIHKADNGCEYDTAFRCYSCTNWQGRYSDKIPIWSSSFRSKGYYLKEEHCSVGKYSERGKDFIQKVLKTESDGENSQKERIRQRSLEEEKNRDIENYDFNRKFMQ